MATVLGGKIKALIAANGPISVADYFAFCLSDPEHGYYMTRQPFGAAGDFTTAPEVSQLFGEMIGIFLIHAWQQHGAPDSVRLAEIGPGRGTMMADIIRTISQLAPDLLAGASIHLVETSAKLRAVQAGTLSGFADRISWHDNLADLPDGFLLVVGNEFFDALPLRQFVKTSQGFRERVVGLDPDGELAFAAGLAGIDPALLPEGHDGAPPGTIMEVAPARNAIMQMISARLKNTGGTALFIDYGHLKPGFGDTLQALLDHRYDLPLANPGRADLTSHVDFAALASVALMSGIHVNGAMSQGEFLLTLGLLERAGRLGAGKDSAFQQQILEAVERLAGNGPAAMGSLFKVMAVSSPAVLLAPFETPRCASPRLQSHGIG